MAFVHSVDRTTQRPWVDRLKGFSDPLAWSAAAGTLPGGAAELALAMGHARIEARGGALEWSWNRETPELDLPLWPLVRSAAELLTASERTLVKRCGRRHRRRAAAR